MITYFVVVVILNIIGVILAPLTGLPDVSLPANISSNLATIGHWFGLIWGVIPLTLVALFAALTVIIGIETKIFSYKLIRWVYSKIPGVN